MMRIRSLMMRHTLALVACGLQCALAAETLPPLQGGKVPANVDELWSGFDPRKEPLDTEVLKEWEQDGVVCRIVRYQVGVFKGTPVMMAAFYAVPKGGSSLPGILHLHGGGQSATLDGVVRYAKRRYACISLNWGGNTMSLGKGNWTGPQTDWGTLDATHPPQRNKSNHFAGPITPDEFTLDPVESPRNSNWFLVLVAARRALTFLEQQPEVDAEKLGVTGHSMGGKLSTNLSGIDSRIKAAVPSCGGSGPLSSTETGITGGFRDKASSKLVTACIAETAYIPRISCPILWLSPTNDFHGNIDNMAWNWRQVPDALLGLSITPHMNHLHTAEHAFVEYLWFEQHLKGALALPKTPAIEMTLKTKDGTPVISVRPDRPAEVRNVKIYYAVDPHTLTRFWRGAAVTKAESAWTASCPVLSAEQPLYAYADVTYEIPEAYRTQAGVPDSGVYALSSRVAFATAATLQSAGVKAADKPERMIDDGSRGWDDWYLSNWDHGPLWRASTRKLKDAKWRGPDGAKLVFEVKPQADSTLVVSIATNSWGAFSSKSPVDYAAYRELKGSAEWQTVSLALGDFHPTNPKISTPPEDWKTVTEFSICPSGEIVRDGGKVRVGTTWSGPREIRNLRWEGGSVSASQAAAGTALDDEDYRKQFNEAIRRANEQEDEEARLKKQPAEAKAEPAAIPQRR